MSCKFNRKLLSLYYDGQTSPRETEEVRSHLASCGDCSEQLNRLKELSAVYRQLLPVKVSVDYELRFQRRLEEAMKGKRISPVIETATWGFQNVLDNLQRILFPLPALLRVTVSILLLIGMVYFGTHLPRRTFLSAMTVKGEVQTYQAGQGQWEMAKIDTILKEGEIIRTGENSFIDLVLSGDAYKLRIKENSELKLSRLKGKTQLALNRGRILVDIGPKFKGKEFKIDTPSGIALAHGTEFSVDVDPKNKRMWLGVLEGEVGVRSKYETALKDVTPLILIRAREKTVVFPDTPPSPPTPLTAEELNILKEIERIGRLLVSLVLSDTSNRVSELLRSPRFYAYGKEPQEVQKLLKEAISLLEEAVEQNERSKHIKAIEKLEKIVHDYPDSQTSPSLLVFIGAYYEWLSLHREAIDIFQKVSTLYAESEVASLAQCAEGIVQERGGNFALAREAYKKVLSDYPQSFEVAEAVSGLHRLAQAYPE